MALWLHYLVCADAGLQAPCCLGMDCLQLCPTQCAESCTLPAAASHAHGWLVMQSCSVADYARLCARACKHIGFQLCRKHETSGREVLADMCTDNCKPYSPSTAVQTQQQRRNRKKKQTLTWVPTWGAIIGMGGGTTKSVTYLGTQSGCSGPTGATCCVLALFWFRSCWSDCSFCCCTSMRGMC
jgi:hypothetical protein